MMNACRCFLFVTVIVASAGCGRSDPGPSGEDPSDGQPPASRGEVALALEHLSSLPEPAGIVGGQARHEAAAQIALWADRPERLQSLLALAATRDPYRRTAAAVAGLADATGAADFALKTVKEPGFEGDPYTMGYLIFWGCKSFEDAFAMARDLLSEEGWRPRVAGHVVVSLTSLQSRLPRVSAVEEPLEEPATLPQLSDWQEVLDTPEPEAIYLSTLEWFARHPPPEPTEGQNLSKLYPLLVRISFRRLLNLVARHPEAYRPPDTRDREELRAYLLKWEQAPQWEDVRKFSAVSVLSDYVDQLWPPRGP